MAKVLMASSGGGHFEQLIMLRFAAAGNEVFFATVDAQQAAAHNATPVALLPDCNLNQPVMTLNCLMKSMILMRQIRPDIVISTGAAPGFCCILWGRILGAQTLWIDSIANADRLSLSGRMARMVAHRCLSQWSHLADGVRVHFAGAVL